MNIALITNSKSGNTAQLAQALREAFAVSDVQLVCDVELPDAPDAAQLEDAAGQALLADAVCVGFWCDKGSCTEGVAKLLERMDGKRVFLFGTCGFGGSQEYFDQIIERVQEHLPQTAELAGAFMCQGKMALAFARATRPCLRRTRPMLGHRRSSTTSMPPWRIPTLTIWMP